MPSNADGGEDALPADFAAVDAGAAHELVAMMDATDAWSGVRAARAWVLERAAVGDGSVVIDAGCGPGSFGGAAAACGAYTVDVDRSLAMVRETARRHRTSHPVLADVARLPMRNGVTALVRAERVLQWTSDPHAALAELWRITAPGGFLAVTDTDWGTFAIDHPDPGARTRLATAALGWVPHARVAAHLARPLADLGAVDPHTRADIATIDAWDPDDPAQRDGPPGLPLRSIAAGGARPDETALEADLAVLADEARAGRFHATLTLVTVVARRPKP